METSNPLVVDAFCGAGLSGAMRARITLGAKDRTILISNGGLSALIEKMIRFSQPHYSHTPRFHHSSAMITGRAEDL